MKIDLIIKSPGALFTAAFACSLLWTLASSPQLPPDLGSTRSDRVAGAIQSIPPQDAVTTTLASHIAAEWSVPAEQSAALVHKAFAASAAYALDPLLVLAVMAQESSFRNFGNAHAWLRNPGAEVNPMAAHGPMQVAGRWHPEKMPRDSSGRIRQTTLEENVQVGAWVLREYLDREDGDVHTALQRYNGNLADPDGRYATSVMRHLKSLERALEGNTGLSARQRDPSNG